MKKGRKDLLEAVSLGRHVLQVLLKSFTKLPQLLLGNHHLLTHQQQGLGEDGRGDHDTKGERER